MKASKLGPRAGLSAALLAAAIVPSTAQAVPILQLFVEGATYDTDHESWVFAPQFGDPIRLWVIGNVTGGGGKGTIEDVKLSFAYEDAGSPVTIVLTPSTTGGFNGVVDPSTPSTPVHRQTVNDGSLPLLFSGKSIPSHGVYGAGVEWQEFGLGDFALTDSPIGDFIDTFPSNFFIGAGQINVYELSVIGDITSLHFDAYNHVSAGNHAKTVFAPFSHDAGTGVNDPVPVPEPDSLPLFALGLGALWVLARRRNRT